MPAMDDLLLRSALIPLAVAALAAGLLRLLAGSAHGPAMAGAAICLAFLIGYILMVGAPAVWPPSAIQKIFFIAVAGGIFGLSVDLSRRARPLTVLGTLLTPALALAWLGWPRVVKLDSADVATLLVVAAAGAAILAELHSRNAQPGESAIKLLIAAIALAAVALLGASASMAQLCGVLAASVAGFALWLWPKPRLRFAASALFGGGLVFIALLGSVAVFTNASKPALCLLLPIFFAGRALGRVDSGLHKLGQAVKPLLVAAIAMIPAIAAVGLAQLLGGSAY